MSTLSPTMTYTNQQVLHGLELAGVKVSVERLRQLRDGYTERRTRKYGEYKKAYEGRLREGHHWMHRGAPVYTEIGVMEVFRLFAAVLTPGIWTAMAAHPRNKWESRQRGQNIT